MNCSTWNKKSGRFATGSIGSGLFHVEHIISVINVSQCSILLNEDLPGFYLITHEK